MNISLKKRDLQRFSAENHRLLVFDEFLEAPDMAIENATLQKFAKITPQYPGIRAPLAADICASWLPQLGPLLAEEFGDSSRQYEMLAWYSLVTHEPGQLIPMQRLPHVDGTNPDQIAMMLYLHRTDHGGTGFYRHRSTGFETLTDENFPRYKAALEQDVARGGMPKAAYPGDGAPYFDRIHQTSGQFNQAVFYRGNILHSGVIAEGAALPADPRQGRLTINAFFRPK